MNHLTGFLQNQILVAHKSYWKIMPLMILMTQRAILQESQKETDNKQKQKHKEAKRHFNKRE
jgi:hypothetical protein